MWHTKREKSEELAAHFGAFSGSWHTKKEKLEELAAHFREGWHTKKYKTPKLAALSKKNGI